MEKRGPSGGERRRGRRRVTSRRLPLLVAVLVALGLALGACGGDDEDMDTDRTAQTQPAETTETTETAPGGDEVSGRAVFVDSGCGRCHTLAAADANGTIGPNLDETVANESPERIRRSIVAPDAEITEGFSPGVMPSDFGERLSDAELDALVEFIAANAGSG